MEKQIISIVSEVLEIDEDELINYDRNEMLNIAYDFNSIQAIQLIVRLEELLNVTIDDDDLLMSTVNTLNNIFKLVDKYKMV